MLIMPRKSHIGLGARDVVDGGDVRIGEGLGDGGGDGGTAGAGGEDGEAELEFGD